MLREIIKPTTGYYSLHIPKEYINKSIEVIVLPLFDLEYKNSQKKTLTAFDPKKFYAVSSESKHAIDTYLQNSKSDGFEIVTNNIDDFKNLDLKITTIKLKNRDDTSPSS